MCTSRHVASTGQFQCVRVDRHSFCWHDAQVKEEKDEGKDTDSGELFLRFLMIPPTLYQNAHTATVPTVGTIGHQRDYYLPELIIIMHLS